jgi:dipeptidyl-peptidase 4
MQFRTLARTTVFAALSVVALLGSRPFAIAQQKPASQAHPGELTVDRIYAQPSLSGRLTRGITWSPDGRKLAYLDTKGTGKEAKTELWTLDAVTAERKLLVSADKLESMLPAAPGRQTQATGAGRRAPSQFQWAPDGEALLFEGPESLAWFDLKSQTGRVLVSGKEELSDVKISPDGKFVSFLRDHNIWLVSVADGKERALTSGGVEETRKGELDWVYPEELDIFSAYWWAPDSSAVAYLEMDERQVSRYPLVNFESYTGGAEMQRYPTAGGSNPTVRVFVASLSGGQPRAMDIGSNTDIYIPRVNWLPDSRRLAIQRLSRDQTVLDLLLADTATGDSSVLLTEKDPYWINLSDDLHFLRDGKRFVWSSERSGYRHVYLYDLSGKELAQLTKGEWEVSHVDGIDEAKGLVYFTATEKSPVERHLYRVALNGSAFSRLTKEDGMHTINLAPNASAYVDTYSSTAAPPRQDLFRDGSKIAAINENRVEDLTQYHLSPVEFFTIKSRDGASLNCSMIKPPHFDPDKKYPVIVYTYGGPHAQVVLNAWGGPSLLWHQMMAQKGYIIFALDNRGSAGRGHIFEKPIHYHFGVQELSDQRDGAAWLSQQPWVDPNRIGIWGWSFGGFMTTTALLEAGDIFKVGFAGGPVTDWHFYDTIYTERYMGLPKQHEEDYVNSSPVKYAGQLKGKLLIAHGTGDDNVHCANTLSLVNELIKNGLYVEVIAAPGRGHGISDPPARRVVWNRVTQFFLDNL